MAEIYMDDMRATQLTATVQEHIYRTQAVAHMHVMHTANIHPSMHELALKYFLNQECMNQHIYNIFLWLLKD